MIPLTAEEAGRALGISPLVTSVEGVSIDTRILRPGDLFVALRGERFDGHDHVVDAFRGGAVGAVVDVSALETCRERLRGSIQDGAEVPLYAVPDTLEALGRLARAVRRRSRAVVIGVTGSVGKTGTKDLLKEMATRFGEVVATAANQNNEIGVPLTLFTLTPHTRVAVVEMGMRGLGQITALAEIAEPDVGVITNIHPVHLELLGTMEGIAQAKAELLAGLAPSGTGVVPADCEALDPFVAKAACRQVRFGLAEMPGCADVWAEHRSLTGGCRSSLTFHWPEGEAQIVAPFASRAKAENAVAAAAACWAAGLPMEECLSGLEEGVFTPGRGDWQEAGDWLLIDDTYNASPAAVQASLDELVRIAADRRGRPVAVLGDMLELGPEAGRLHEGIGSYAAQVGVQVLWGVGKSSVATVAAFRRAAPERVSGRVGGSCEAAPVIASLAPGDVILFKASRSLKLESMVDLVREAAAGQGSSDTLGCADGAPQGEKGAWS